MKLYVWTDVLHNYTAGMAVALAEDVEHAIRLVAAKLEDKGYGNAEWVLEELRRARCLAMLSNLAVRKAAKPPAFITSGVWNTCGFSRLSVPPRANCDEMASMVLAVSRGNNESQSVCL